MIEGTEEFLDGLYETFCKTYCPYASNREKEPERYKRGLEPCLNCPVESFTEFIAEYVDEFANDRAANIERYKRMKNLGFRFDDDWNLIKESEQE